MHKTRVAMATALLVVSGMGCQGKKDDAPGGGTAEAKVIAIDGSSTVFPITEAVAEDFKKDNKTPVTIGVSGTGGGFKKFCNKETAISGASRPIKPSEVKACGEAGVEYIELPVAYDGLAIVVHAKNDWVDHLTVAELKTMWEPAAQKKVTKWNQIREGWPDKEIHLFGPGVDSGTYDYFTEAVVGEEHKSRGDYTSSEDDNVLVQGVTGDESALGFFGYAYYIENKDKLKLVPVDDGKDDNGKGPIAPSPETVANGTYQPLARPIFIYVSKKELERKEVIDFVNFYLDKGGKLASEVGYITLPAKVIELTKKRFADRKTGSMFGGEGSKVGVSLEELLAK
ncbi:MAG TPA: PstS family phosphate ABC transporter substrate-binding protein [Polyangiaceae bacterium]|jgi:phosphate transport system substrate-binding protein|nr:PstS family phosphate ABC transporter substrate-binding protein [Polyangiaceae bacterium]